MHFDDVTTVNCALCDIAHLTFQMRKVSVTRNLSQTTRRSLPGAVDGWGRNYLAIEVTVMASRMMSFRKCLLNSHLIHVCDTKINLAQ